MKLNKLKSSYRETVSDRLWWQWHCEKRVKVCATLGQSCCNRTACVAQTDRQAADEVDWDIHEGKILCFSNKGIETFEVADRLRASPNRSDQVEPTTDTGELHHATDWPSQSLAPLPTVFVDSTESNSLPPANVDSLSTNLCSWFFLARIKLQGGRKLEKKWEKKRRTEVETMFLAMTTDDQAHKAVGKVMNDKRRMNFCRTKKCQTTRISFQTW